ncbi:MAG: hypothetical protein GWP59_04405 [Chlamydiales bacterium]|nr:HEAT repeat domain-containing protein [Chlamydiales bacterium]NCF70925.1 hypothetical protein [Chlamydiales bacterium]
MVRIAILVASLAFSACQKNISTDESPEIRQHLHPFSAKKQDRDFNTASKSLLIQQGKVDDILRYVRSSEELLFTEKKQLLTKLCQKILVSKMLSRNFHDNAQGFYGAFLSLDPQTIHEMTGRIPHLDPRLQLAVLNYLDHLQEDSKHLVIKELLGSPYPFLRIEAAYRLAANQDPTAFQQLEALFYKSPQELHFLFAKAFILLKTPRAKKFTLQLLNHSDEKNRSEAIKAIADMKELSFYDELLTLSKHPSPLTQEASAYALGKISPDHATAPLFSLAKKPHRSVQLAALNALVNLKEYEPRQELLQHAKKGNLFAYHLLSDERESKKFLKQMTYHNDPTIRYNAAIALLELKDPDCLSALLELLLLPSDEQALKAYLSPGETLKEWRLQSIGRVDKAHSQWLIQQSLQHKLELFYKAQKLPSSAFFWLCDKLLTKQKSEWIPHIVGLLQADSSPKALEILQKHTNTPGAPLLRIYCHLALFQKTANKEELDHVVQWVRDNQKHPIMRLKDLPDWDERQNYPFQLSPEQKSQFLIDAYFAISSTYSDLALDLLLDGLSEGAVENRPILAGLLLHLLN